MNRLVSETARVGGRDTSVVGTSSSYEQSIVRPVTDSSRPTLHAGGKA
jgi:hypothetical protein